MGDEVGRLGPCEHLLVGHEQDQPEIVIGHVDEDHYELAGRRVVPADLRSPGGMLRGILSKFKRAFAVGDLDDVRGRRDVLPKGFKVLTSRAGAKVFYKPDGNDAFLIAGSNIHDIANLFSLIIMYGSHMDGVTPMMRMPGCIVSLYMNPGYTDYQGFSRRDYYYEFGLPAVSISPHRIEGSSMLYNYRVGLLKSPVIELWLRQSFDVFESLEERVVERLYNNLTYTEIVSNLRQDLLKETSGKHARLVLRALRSSGSNVIGNMLMSDLYAGAVVGVRLGADGSVKSIDVKFVQLDQKQADFFKGPGIAYLSHWKGIPAVDGESYEWTTKHYRGNGEEYPDYVSRYWAPGDLKTQLDFIGLIFKPEVHHVINPEIQGVIDRSPVKLRTYSAEEEVVVSSEILSSDGRETSQGQARSGGSAASVARSSLVRGPFRRSLPCMRTTLLGARTLMGRRTPLAGAGFALPVLR